MCLDIFYLVLPICSVDYRRQHAVCSASGARGQAAVSQRENQKGASEEFFDDRLASGIHRTALRGSHLHYLFPQLFFSLFIGLLLCRLRLGRNQLRPDQTEGYEGELDRTFVAPVRESSRWGDRGLFSSPETSAEASRDLEREERLEELRRLWAAEPRPSRELSLLFPCLLPPPEPLLRSRRGRRSSPDRDDELLRDSEPRRLPPFRGASRSLSPDGLRLNRPRPGLLCGLRLRVRLSGRLDEVDDDLDLPERRPRSRDLLRDGE